MTAAIRFCCPQCRGPLTTEPGAYHCPACPRAYPIRFGIPDFRLAPDPYISMEDECKKASLLADQAGQLSFEELVRFYWKLTPEVPPEAVERYVRYALSGEERGAACLQAMDASLGQPWSGQSCLEIGCGTGGFLVAAQDRFEGTVGIDIALRWLVIARKRLQEAGRPAVLACCSGERLPFADDTFDGAVGMHVLEHTQHPQAVLSETTRTLKPNAACFFSTPNRFSLGPEPCVRVWGVGFLPRSAASGYVRLVRGIPYRNIRLLSAFKLRRLLSRSGLREWTISPPRISPCEKQAVSGVTRVLITLYQVVREIPGFSSVLQLVGPLLQVVGRK